MPQFSTEPPEDLRGHALQLMRCPQMKPIKAVVTCDQLIGCKTHFFGGRTVPCEQESCPACHEGLPWRWHSYLSAYQEATKFHFLFESTARATEPFILYRKAHLSLRGCEFRAHRANSRHNARVIIETKPVDLEAFYLPPPPDLLKCLSIIWNLPEPSVKPSAPLRGGNGLVIEPNGATRIDKLLNDTFEDRKARVEQEREAS